MTSAGPICRGSSFAGATWPTVNVTASFMPDGTPTDTGEPSNLFYSLGRHLSLDQWQGAYRRALAAWDGASALATRWVGEGDIRFGGRTLPSGIMGWSYGPGEGDIAGDSFLGTNYEYLAGDLDLLLAVMLHETGHSLGLDHSHNLNAVMYPMLNIRSTLAPDDVARIRALYGPPPGPPPDRYEGNSNNSPGTATGLGRITSLNLTGLTLHSSRDEDWYQFRAGATGNYRLTCAFEEVGGVGGIFFVAVFNTSLVRLARASATSGAVILPARLVAGQHYYLRMLSPTGRLFRYGLKMERV